MPKTGPGPGVTSSNLGLLRNRMPRAATTWNSVTFSAIPPCFPRRPGSVGSNREKVLFTMLLLTSIDPSCVQSHSNFNRVISSRFTMAAPEQAEIPFPTVPTTIDVTETNPYSVMGVPKEADEAMIKRVDFIPLGSLLMLLRVCVADVQKDGAQVSPRYRSTT